jgi:hypothetical protein
MNSVGAARRNGQRGVDAPLDQDGDLPRRADEPKLNFFCCGRLYNADQSGFCSLLWIVDE